jgi:hypothetical protein
LFFDPTFPTRACWQIQDETVDAMRRQQVEDALLYLPDLQYGMMINVYFCGYVA